MSGGSVLPSTRASRQEALEQQAVLHRIDRGDAETERDGGVGGAAAALAEDALVLREAHRVGHDEKEAGEPEIARSARSS